MPERDVKDLTGLLQAWRKGEKAARDRLVALVYDELRWLARRAMRGESHESTLQPTALVSEAFLRLNEVQVEWNDRVHFFAFAANLMRRILIDEARRRQTLKRGGERPISLSGLDIAAPELDLLVVDDALKRLAIFDERKSRILELRLFSGLTIEETAVALEVSHATVERDLKLARAWLAKELGQTPV
jgi:RNA polymerase sigma factor (TIGR02999 family)